ncbi:MAG: hypothetical protein F6J95_001855 [Leptolyngbya sp. SIO1E4]|nr:hypothetical protein [Leptolyngbya sp. SIO1E4]
MTDPKLLAQAKQGDVSAIAALLNQSFQPQGIWAQVDPQGSGLRIILESTQAPDPEVTERRIQSGLARLQPQNIAELTVWGRALGETQPAWERRIVLTPGAAASSSPKATTPPANRLPPTNKLSQSAATPVRRGDRPRPSPVPPANRARLTRSPQRRVTRKPLVLKGSDFDPMMLAIIGFVAVYGFFGSLNPSYDGPFMWLHLPNLAIHETGHLLFMPFGRFLMLLGGSVTQIAFPAVFTGYFFVSRQYFSSALTLFWTGQNFMDVAVYIRDAPVRLLPLTTNNIDAHDWWQLLNMMGLLKQAGLIANMVHGIGVLVYIASVIAGVYFAYRHHRFNQE